MNAVTRKKRFSIFDFRFSVLSMGWSVDLIFKVAIIVALLSFISCSHDLISDLPEIEKSGNSPYINQIFDYQYGPGQHATLIPASEKGSNFIGEPWGHGKSFTSLGGWGGYVVAGFDHAVSNTNGPDIAIYTQPSVSSEPGVVFVMADNNNDGLPNDGAWFEIKGSEYNHPETIHNYQITYYKPSPSGLVTWKDNQGKSGTLLPEFGAESWWWTGYGDKTSVEFSGVKLPDAYFNSSKDPLIELWLPRTGLFRYGYAECYFNEDYNGLLKANFLDISSAVDASGSPANLTKINFIKVQSGIFQIAGWLNEISTEISGAADIHLLDKNSY